MARLGLRSASAGWKQQHPNGWTDPGGGGGTSLYDGAIFAAA